MGGRVAEVLGSSPCIHPLVFPEGSLHCATKEFASTSYQIGGPDHIRMCEVSPRSDDTMHVSEAYGSALLLESPFEDVFDATFQLKTSAGIPRTCSRMVLLRKSGEFPVSNEELDDTATTVYEGF
jgi:hypothetical protein